MDNLRSFTTRNNSRSLLFLTELILAILIFALSMGICGSIFVKAFEAATTSSNLSNAVFLAENAAEVFHLEDDPLTIANHLGGALSVSGEIAAHYDRQWQLTESENAAYVLSVVITEEGNIKKAAAPLPLGGSSPPSATTLWSEHHQNGRGDTPLHSPLFDSTGNDISYTIKKAAISISGGNGEIYSLISIKNTAFSGVKVHD